MFVRLLVCIYSVFLLSCAGPQVIKNPYERIDGKGYSLLPPQEEGWMIGYKGNNGISMGKEGENLDESYVFSVEIIELPDTINSRIALDAIVEMLQMQHFSSEWYAERHELIEKKNIPDPERKACTKSYWIEKDYGAKRKSGIQSPMFIRVYALYCVHPYNKAKLAMIGYSHRYDEGKEDPRFTQKANSFFKNVSLDEF